MAGRKTRVKKGGCCGAAGGRRTRRKSGLRGGSVVADALVTVGALAAWKYLSKSKKGGRRVLPTRKHSKHVAR